jgi:hypothetical protein
MSKKLILFEGPGHSWLRVPLEELDALGIQDKISGFSHRDAQFAFLGEGKDIQVYLEAANVGDDIDHFDPCRVLYWGLLSRGTNSN